MDNKYIVLYQPIQSKTDPFVLIDPTEKSIYKFDLITKQAYKIADYNHIDIGVTASLFFIHNKIDNYTIKFYSKDKTTIAYCEFAQNNIRINLENSDLLHEFYTILMGAEKLSGNICIECYDIVINDYNKQYDTHFTVSDDIINEILKSY